MVELSDCEFQPVPATSVAALADEGNQLILPGDGLFERFSPLVVRLKRGLVLSDALPFPAFPVRRQSHVLELLQCAPHGANPDSAKDRHAFRGGPHCLSLPDKATRSPQLPRDVGDPAAERATPYTKPFRWKRMVTRVPGSVCSKSTDSASARMTLVPSPAPGWESLRPRP